MKAFYIPGTVEKLRIQHDQYRQGTAQAELTFQCGRQTVGSGDMVFGAQWKCGVSPPKSREKVPLQVLEYKVFFLLFLHSPSRPVMAFLIYHLVSVQENDRFKIFSMNFTIPVYPVQRQGVTPEH